ncbi:hypothetical protein P261_01210 [Lachnospiraceae bacterium TWA4]|nr:hypothetical protein P261_01210 [Lachnospiraceae bacterium TWA4]
MNKRELCEQIKRSANAHYNKGLKLAKERRLTPAIEELLTCLEHYKKHIDARNLLGLIYYEMGEIILAKEQWKLSVNYQPQDNLATTYLDLKSSEENHLRGAIIKYNQALYSLHTDSYDVGRLQIKKALEENPNLLKAQCLMALVYIKEDKISRAKKALEKALSIDKEYPMALYYLNEVSKIPVNKREEQKEERIQSISNDGVLMPKSYVPVSLSKGFIYILAGLVLGIIATWVLIFPAQKQAILKNGNDSISTYSKKISTKDTEIANLNNQIDELTKAKAKAESALNEYTAKDGVLASYDQVFKSIQGLMEDDYLTAYQAFATLKKILLIALLIRSFMMY